MSGPAHYQRGVELVGTSGRGPLWDGRQRQIGALRLVPPCDNQAVSNRYPVIDVSSVARDLIEPMGTKRKFWFTGADGARWLFKYSRPQTGEHWSEKIAAEIGALLGIPAARVELAMCDGSPGACSQSFLPRESALVHGNELLQELDQTYPVTELRGVSKHTVDAVFGQLLTVDPPIGSPATLSAADCFVGYLLLDALIGKPPTRTQLRPRLLAGARAPRRGTCRPPGRCRSKPHTRPIRDARGLGLLCQPSRHEAAQPDRRVPGRGAPSIRSERVLAGQVSGRRARCYREHRVHSSVGADH